MIEEKKLKDIVNYCEEQIKFLREYDFEQGTIEIEPQELIKICEELISERSKSCSYTK